MGTLPIERDTGRGIDRKPVDLSENEAEELDATVNYLERLNLGSFDAPYGVVIHLSSHCSGLF